MMDMTIKIEVPELAAAIVRLAAALTPPDPNTLTPDEPRGIPAPVNPTPAAVPTMTAPVMAPGPSPAPVTTAPQMGGQMAPPINTAAPAPAPAPAAVPVAPPPTYNLDQISRAGAALVDAGKMEPLLALLSRYGVAAVTQLAPEQYGAFATELRALGAQI